MNLIVININTKKKEFEGTEREIASNYNLNSNQVKWLRTMKQTFLDDLLIVSHRQFKNVISDPHSINSELYGSY